MHGLMGSMQHQQQMMSHLQAGGAANMMAEAREMQQRALAQKKEQAEYLTEQRRLRAEGQKGDPNFRELTMGGIDEANVQDYAAWCKRAAVERLPSVMQILKEYDALCLEPSTLA